MRVASAVYVYRLPSAVAVTRAPVTSVDSVLIGPTDAHSNSMGGGGRGIRTPEGLHLSGFQARGRTIRHCSRTFANVRAVFHASTFRSPTFANVRHRSRRLPSALPSPLRPHSRWRRQLGDSSARAGD